MANELKRLIEHATPADWEVGEYSDTLGYDCMTGGIRVGPLILDGKEYDQQCCAQENEVPPERMISDANLIAYLRNNAQNFVALLEAADAVDTDWNADSAKAFRLSLAPFAE